MEKKKHSPYSTADTWLSYVYQQFQSLKHRSHTKKEDVIRNELKPYLEDELNKEGWISPSAAALLQYCWKKDSPMQLGDLRLSNHQRFFYQAEGLEFVHETDEGDYQLFKSIYRKKAPGRTLRKLLRVLLREGGVYDSEGIILVGGSADVPQYNFIDLSKRRSKPLLEELLLKDKVLGRLYESSGGSHWDFDTAFNFFLSAYEKQYEHKNELAIEGFARTLQRAFPSFVPLGEYYYSYLLSPTYKHPVTAAVNDIVNTVDGTCIKAVVLTLPQEDVNIPYNKQFFVDMLEKQLRSSPKSIGKQLDKNNLFFEYHGFDPEGTPIVFYRPHHSLIYFFSYGSPSPHTLEKNNKQDLKLLRDISELYTHISQSMFSEGTKVRRPSSSTALSYLVDRQTLITFLEKEKQTSLKNRLLDYIQVWNLVDQETIRQRTENEAFLKALLPDKVTADYLPEMIIGKNYIKHPKPNGYKSIHQRYEEENHVIEIQHKTNLQWYKYYHDSAQSHHLHDQTKKATAIFDMLKNNYGSSV
ncbi:MAG: hypothetical protein QW594_03385, partial [Candidatus Woesearchaeota archaeon]